jgi:glycerol-3-phosphate dehydrogenase subunit C
MHPHHSQPEYWQEGALKKEMERVFDVCHGCRRCLNVCPSFNTLFKRIDEIDDRQTAAAGGLSAAAVLAGASTEMKEEGRHAAAVDPSLAAMRNPVESLADADHQRVVDECYQCKLCFNLCPYHPPHRFQLDFPRLMQRSKAVRVADGRGAFRDKLFAQVDWVGTISCFFAPFVNWANKSKLQRKLLRLLLGVHPDRQLPLFHFETFRKWWSYRGPKGARRQRVVLFYTCSVNYNEPRTGKAAVAVLEKNGFEVVCPPQQCCGMPHLDGGDIAAAMSAARRNLRWLVPFAQQGVPIIALGPTCSLMLRDEYPALLQSEDARLVAKMTFDVSEFLIKLKKEGRLVEDFKPSARRIAYQAACHLKAQNIGLKAKELLSLLPGAQVGVIDRCTSHDGTWSMKEEYFDLSMKYAKKLFAQIEEAKPDAVATDCPLAGIQIEQGTGLRPVHPVELVAQAYGCETD